MNLLLLPDELLLNIGEQITSESDLNNFHQVNRRFYRMFDEYRYKYNAKYHDGHALYWAGRYGNATTARKSAMAGTSLHPRPWPFTWEGLRGRCDNPLIEKYLKRPLYSNWVDCPLTHAVWWNQPEVTRLLLELRAYPDPTGAPPHRISLPDKLIHQTSLRVPSALQELLEHGVNIDVTGTYSSFHDQTALLRASRYGFLETVELLLKYGADPDKSRESGSGPLHWAARFDFLDIMERLLDAGADINAQMRVIRDTPILHAARNHAYDSVGFLVERGADVNLAGAENHTPLYYVTRSGSPELMEKLLRHGARPDITCLFKALSNWERDDHYKRAKPLLEYGLDPNTPMQTTKGPKFLFPWVFQQWWLDDSVIELLLEHGLDPNLTSPGSYPSLLTVATGEFGYAVPRLMLEHGADPNVANRDGATPLLVAAANRHPKLVEMLLPYGADPNIALRGKSLLDWATKRGRGDIIELLAQNSREQ